MSRSMLGLLLGLACVARGGDGEALKKDLASAAAQKFDHRDFDQFLKACVQRGAVDYAKGRVERARLDKYLSAVAAAKLSELSRDEQLALLINAYNASTIKLILDHDPGLNSIRDLPDPWKTVAYVIGGHKVSLDQLEHEVLRPVFKDARVHAAVNCASVGCGPLRAAAFTGNAIGTQLDEQFRAWLADRRCARIEDGKLLVSHVFEWFGDDFVTAGYVNSKTTIPAFIAAYASGDVKTFLDAHDANVLVSYIDYDWSLNDAARLK